MEDSSKQMMIDSAPQEDGYGDIDHSGEGSHVALGTDKKRCQPLRVPFNSEFDIQIESSSIVPENDLLLFQVPSLFPTMVPVQPVTSSSSSATPTKKTARGTPSRGSTPGATKQPENPKTVGTLFTDIPDGRIGTLRVHKSGKTVFRIGDTDFAVSEGQQTNFRTEIACVCPTESEVIFLGQATKRVVVSPVIV
jgi:DNA-directed RNA polymerase III subunit RPC4